MTPTEFLATAYAANLDETWRAAIRHAATAAAQTQRAAARFPMLAPILADQERAARMLVDFAAAFVPLEDADAPSKETTQT